MDDASKNISYEVRSEMCENECDFFDMCMDGDEVCALLNGKRRGKVDGSSK